MISYDPDPVLHCPRCMPCPRCHGTGWRDAPPPAMPTGTTFTTTTIAVGDVTGGDVVVTYRARCTRCTGVGRLLTAGDLGDTEPCLDCVRGVAEPEDVAAYTLEHLPNE